MACAARSCWMRPDLLLNQQHGCRWRTGWGEGSKKCLFTGARPAGIIISCTAALIKRFGSVFINKAERNEESFPMKQEWIQKLETFLEGQDFGKNWDGAYQDAVPTLRTFFDKQGFRTHIMPEWLSDSRDTELVAEKEKLVVRIPWAEDYNGKSVVDLTAL